jgi:hypothetical protein
VVCLYSGTLPFRVHNAKSRLELEMGIKESYHFENRSPDVVHWETIANLSGYLDQYVAGFAEGCMSFRHFRLHRHSKTREVIMQVSFSMIATAIDDCSGNDANDPWRGLKPLTHHSVVFDTPSGVPGIYSAFKDGLLPRAQKRADDPELLAAISATIEKLAVHFPSFKSMHLEDCRYVLTLFTRAAAEFPWSDENMARMFDYQHASRPPALVPDTPAQSQYDFSLPMPERDDFVLCQPPDPEDGEEPDPFWIGRVKKVPYIVHALFISCHSLHYLFVCTLQLYTLSSTYGTKTGTMPCICSGLPKARIVP